MKLIFKCFTTPAPDEIYLVSFSLLALSRPLATGYHDLALASHVGVAVAHVAGLLPGNAPGVRALRQRLAMLVLAGVLLHQGREVGDELPLDR